MTPMVLLQWNMGVFSEGEDEEAERRRSGLLQTMLREHRPDLVVLQEAPRVPATAVLRDGGYSVAAPRQRLVTAWRSDVWSDSDGRQPIAYTRASAVVLEPVAGGRRLLLCNVHFPSRVGAGSDKKTGQSLGDLVAEIQQFRMDLSAGDVSEIVAGDFNLEPHEDRLQDENGFYASRGLLYVGARERKRPAGERKRPLYNPSWQLYGALTEPHGTVYNTTSFGEPWAVFDQALFSADLLQGPIQAHLVTKTAGQSLLSAKVSQPNRGVGSDHLPIVWSAAPLQSPK